MTRHELIVAGLAIDILSGCSSPSVASRKDPAVYSCAHGRRLFVHHGEEHASLDFAGQHYELERRPSGIGLRYASKEATLIIDGDSLVFVNHRNVDLETCRAASA